MQNDDLEIDSALLLPAEPAPDLPRDWPAGDSQSPLSANETHSFIFTGSGREYFRIWIVNLCLTIATLGIYSAWAKVRRLQYFDRNTRLGAAVFDFHGDPKAILKGRAVAVGLLAAYEYAFGFSRAFGLAVVCFLLLALPWMMRSALRFRLRNTSFRGLRFDFGGSLAGAYLAYLPAILLFLLPTVIVALDPARVRWFGAVFLLYLGWPYLHASIKRYQHRHLAYGSMRSAYAAPTGEFFAAYFFAALMGFFAIFIAGVFAAIAAVAATAKAGGSEWAYVIPIATMALFGYVAYLLSGPYLQARIYNLTWCNTGFPNVAIHSGLSGVAYIKLQTVNAALTLLTLGLYRPFAVVRTYRYRLEHMSVGTGGTFEQMLCGERKRAGGASGDGAADFLGVDLSW